MLGSVAYHREHPAVAAGGSAETQWPSVAGTESGCCKGGLWALSVVETAAEREGFANTSITLEFKAGAVRKMTTTLSDPRGNHHQVIDKRK